MRLCALLRDEEPRYKSDAIALLPAELHRPPELRATLFLFRCKLLEDDDRSRIGQLNLSIQGETVTVKDTGMCPTGGIWYRQGKVQRDSVIRINPVQTELADAVSDSISGVKWCIVTRSRSWPERFGRSSDVRPLLPGPSAKDLQGITKPLFCKAYTVTIDVELERGLRQTFPIFQCFSVNVPLHAYASLVGAFRGHLRSWSHAKSSYTCCLWGGTIPIGCRLLASWPRARKVLK